MAGEIASAFVRVRPEMKGFKAETHAGVKSAFGGLGSIASGAGAAIATGLKAATIGVGILGGAVGVAGMKFNSMREQAQIAFTTMLGSGQKAKAFLDELQSFAAKTPFEFPDLVSSSQKLLAMGFAAKDVIPTMTAIGDAVAGLGGGADVLNNVTRALGQIQAKGKASAQEMLQLSEAGIPAWKMLADAIGKSIPEAMKLVEKGAIDSKTTIDAVVSGMNKRFGGMMEKQSHSFAGLLSTIKDTFNILSGTVLRPFFEMAVKGMQRFVDFLPRIQEHVNTFMAAKGFGAKLNIIWDGVQAAGAALAGKIGEAVAGIDWQAVWARAVGVGESVAVMLGNAIAAVPWGDVWGRASGIADALAVRLSEVDWAVVGTAIGDNIAAAIGRTLESAKKITASLNRLTDAIDWNTIGRNMGPGIAAAMLSAIATIVDIGFWVRNWDLVFAIIIAVFGRGIGKIVAPVGRLLKTTLGKVWDDAIQAITGAVEKQFPKIASVMLAVLTRLPGLVGAGLKKLEEVVSAAFAKLGALTRFTVKVLGISAVINAIQGLVEAVADFVKKILDKIGGLSPAIALLAGPIGAAAAAIGQAITSGVLSGLGNLFSRVASSIKDKVSGAIGWVRGHLGSTAEEHAAKEIGKPVADGIIMGFLLGIGELPKKMKDSVRAALERLRETVQSKQGLISDAFSRLGSNGIRAFEAATSAQLARMQTAFDSKVKRLVTGPMAAAIAALDRQQAGIMSGIDALQRELTPAEKALRDFEQARADADLALRRSQLAEKAEALSRPATVARRESDTDEEFARNQLEAETRRLEELADVRRQMREMELDDEHADLRRRAETERAEADRQLEQSRLLAQGLYDQQRAAIEQRFEAVQAGLQRTYDREVLNYTSERELQGLHLGMMLETLQKQLALHPEEWKKINARIQALFKTSFGPDYKTAGKNLGSGFAKGIRESFSAVEAAAADLAGILAKYLPHSPAEKGPLSKPINWAGFLADGLKPGLVAGALAASLAGAGLPGLGGVSGASGVPQLTGALAPLGTLVRLQADVLEELRRQTALAADGRLVQVAVNGETVEAAESPNEIAMAARR